MSEKTPEEITKDFRELCGVPKFVRATFFMYRKSPEAPPIFGVSGDKQDTPALGDIYFQYEEVWEKQKWHGPGDEIEEKKPVLISQTPTGKSFQYAGVFDGRYPEPELVLFSPNDLILHELKELK